MFEKAIYPQTRQVLNQVASANPPGDFYLAGGTGLAVQLGHRRSVDLDFFSPQFPKRDLLLGSVRHLSPRLIQEAEGTLDLIINTVNVSFLEYTYPLLRGAKRVDELGAFPIASVLDIACMKLTAISSRGTKKDFYDLYFILQKMDWEELWPAFKRKYEGVDYNRQHILKSLIYFSSAEKEPEPDMLEDISWEEVKQYLESLALRKAF
jgi:hypothetical protein